jgi:hypothetical protein
MKSQIAQAKAQIAAFVSGETRGIMDAVEIVKALVMIVVIGAIGVFIADKTLTATGTPSNNYLYNFSNNTLKSADTGSQFLVILIIAFIGGIAITYLALFTNVGRRAK